MLLLVTTLSTFIILQGFQEINSITIRQIATEDRVTTAPLISTASPIQRATVSTNVDAAANAHQASVVSTLPTSSTSGTTTDGGLPTVNMIGNSGINVLRRGTEFLANQIAAALGGVTSLVNILENTSQTGELYASNLGTSMEELTGRLLNYGYNVATNLLQELTNQVSTSLPTGTVFRPNQFTILRGRPISGNRATVFGRAQQLQPQNRFGLITNFRNENSPGSIEDTSDILDFENNDEGILSSRRNSFGEGAVNVADDFINLDNAEGGTYDSFSGNVGNMADDFSSFGQRGGFGTLFGSITRMIRNTADNLPNFNNSDDQFLSRTNSISRRNTDTDSIDFSTVGRRLNRLMESPLFSSINTSASNSKDANRITEQFKTPPRWSPVPVITETTGGTLVSTK